MSTNFDTNNKTLGGLLGNGITYTVPTFQRDYSWEQEQWEDLWLDILDIVEAEKPTEHYMAYLVLQKMSHKNFNIIDGQQRLTTISIIILCILRCIKKNLDLLNGNTTDDNDRITALRRTYIGSLDIVSLQTKSKLNLNRNNDFYYQNYIVPLRDELPTKGHKASELLMCKASEWFDKKIDEYIKEKKIPNQELSKELSLFVDKMADNLFFTVITVTDELNAYTVFETLNTRGVRLSTPDLLKNYLFSIIDDNGSIHKNELHFLAQRWEKLSEKLEDNGFSDFLRCYWIGHYKSVRKLDLFKDMKKVIRKREDAFGLIKSLEDVIELYMNLAKPQTNDFKDNKATEAARILKIFNTKQFYCIVLSAKKILAETELTKLLQIFVVISFRYNVIASLPPNELEKQYQKIALDITNGNIKNLNDIIHALRDIYVSDDKFTTDFAQASLSNKKIIDYILSEIESQQGGTKPDPTSYTIEHILPKNANLNDWKVSDSEHNAFVNRLGNLALLEASKNNKLGDKPYADKKAVFEQSCFVTTQTIAEKYSDWTIDTIEGRQYAMAKIAKTIWKIPQFIQS